MGGVVLLTGGTGFLGTQIARRLMTQTEHQLVVLVQAPDLLTADIRLRRAFWDWPELRDSVGKRVEVVAGDVARPQLGLPAEEYRRLVHRVTHIVHAAADIHLLAPIESLRSTNVEGVAHILDFARAVQADHGLLRLAHVSTAYVAGRRTGVIFEDPPTGEAGFANAYEQSKCEGERLVQQVRDKLPISIFRPAMIVGDSRTGAILTFNTFYFPVRRYLMNGARIMATGPELRVNIIPVDYVADAIVRLTFDPRAEGLTFHLTAPRSTLPTAGEVASTVRAWAETNLGTRLPRLASLPVSIGARLVQFRDPKLYALIQYFNEQREFRRDNVDRLLGPYELDWRVFLPRLLDYAAGRAFMNGSSRTVHEQILFRLGSHAGAVTFHDIVDGRSTTRSASEVRREISAAAAALQAMGVKPGSRVAIVGLNSSRYLSLDVAIGLCGAVSIPLYYTSPPAEVDAILRSSRADLLLVGAPAVLNRLSELSTSVPVVSFCRSGLPASLRRTVLSWDAFLARGTNSCAPLEAPVDLDDVATIRYTSGTTGPAKGVVFTHAQLRWMAQTIVSLLPWQTRKEANHYLSFLPLNHVVEGILCTYASYNLPGPAHIYFLEDFRSLGTQLPRVRPTIFFGVPRIYEKALARLSSHPLGRLLAGRRGALERRLLRRLLLHAMGLDRCAQLLVGSAPPGDALLRAYREIGIEVHNAYGLTEAPLVALNRLGRNRIETVGELLPDTQARIAADGEILVRGPQVTTGYDDSQIASPIEAGWLHTGDLGALTDDRYLVVDGRRKEMIATSYAKKVSPEKVEALLRRIPGVAEVLLVGDQRPYCAALLWVDENDIDARTRAGIDAAVSEVSRQLSPPERPRRWVILPNDLSIERGDLTANLKPKRAALLHRFAPVVDALYANPGAAGGLPGTAGVEAVGVLR